MTGQGHATMLAVSTGNARCVPGGAGRAMIQRAGAPARLWLRVMLLFALFAGSALARPAAAGQFIVSSVNPTAITFPTPTSADFDFYWAQDGPGAYSTGLTFITTPR